MAADTTAVQTTIVSPFLNYLGMQFSCRGEGWAEVLLPIRPEMLNSAGMVHGGIYATLADCALAAALHTRVPIDQIALTADLSCRYLRAARGGTLRALGKVLQIGRRIAVAEAEIFADDVLLVKATGSFMIASRADMITPSVTAE